MEGLSFGRILGVDFGDRRIGLALSDPMQIIASPHSVIDRRKTTDYLAAIRELISTKDICRIVVGLPISMKGTDSQQTGIVREFIAELRTAVSVPVSSIDERLSSVAAEKVLYLKGIKTGHNKSDIDKTAACIFLQEYLDSA